MSTSMGSGAPPGGDAPYGPVLLHRHARLPPVPESAGRARRLLRNALCEAGRPQWSDAAELACTEVVTNGVLHARTDLDITVDVHDGGVRVGVHDANPALPAQRSYGVQATTGRGLALVAALSREQGVADAGPSGKTVWFVVAGDESEQTEDELLASWGEGDWGLEELDEPAPSRVSTTTVHLLNLPPTLWLASRQHHDGLLRELVLHLAAHTDEGDADVDLEGTDRARTLLSTAVLGVLENARSEEADRAGLPPEHPSPLPVVPRSIDVELEVPPPDVSAFGSLQDTLDVAERLATQGRLLTAPGLPEVVAVRDWACEQVVAQLNGATAAPWPGTAQERFTEAVHAETGQVVPAAVLPWVTDADRGVVAVDRANRVAAVSAPLARLLGWEVADLVGRRVVALIPPALREAHVSGFSRYLSTGEAHILGVPLTLPVLHADGVTETLCEFMVEQAQSDDGRPVFLAWISPAPREAGSQAGEVALSGYRTATSGEAGDARG